MPVRVQVTRVPRRVGPDRRSARFARWAALKIGRIAYGFGRAAWKLNRWGQAPGTDWVEWEQIKAARSPVDFLPFATLLTEAVPAQTWTVAEYAQGMSNDDRALLDEGRRIWKTL